MKKITAEEMRKDPAKVIRDSREGAIEVVGDEGTRIIVSCPTVSEPMCESCQMWKHSDWNRDDWGICRLSSVRRTNNKTALMKALGSISTHKHFGCIYHEERYDDE